MKERTKDVVIVLSAVGLIGSLILGSYLYLNIVGLTTPSAIFSNAQTVITTTASDCTSSIPNMSVDWQGNGTINIQKFFDWIDANQSNEGMIGSVNATQIVQLLGPQSTLSINEVQFQSTDNGSNTLLHFVFIGSFHVQESWGYINTNKVTVDTSVPNVC